jgi:hypothetical protein
MRGRYDVASSTELIANKKRKHNGGGGGRSLLYFKKKGGRKCISRECDPRNDEHYLFGALNIRVVRRGTGRPARNMHVCIGVTEDEACRFSCKARHVMTNGRGECTLDFPIGKAVVAVNARNYQIAWVTLDRTTDVEIET